MIITIILALSICELLCFDTAATVIFTTIFCLCSFSCMIYFKLALGLDDEEVEIIRSYIKRAREIKRRFKSAISKRKPVRARTERAW